jgi:mRNA-degrading endonuclease RelE of RelBE toxin-antitoxin system
VKRIAFSPQAKADLRAIPQPIAMNILEAIHRLAETGTGRVKMLKGQSGEKRLRVGDYRIRFTEENPTEPGSGEAALHIHSVRNRKEAYR